jgi:HSP20 family molecular chaperone IbpA
MSRMTPFSSPLLLGFDTMEKTLERIAKGSEGYPPYNIERIRASDDGQTAERLRITLAVAGFCEERSRRHHRREPVGDPRPSGRRGGT